MRGRGLDEELSRLERAVRGGEATPEALLRLGQLYLRADRAREAVAVFDQALAAMPPLVQDQGGEVALDPLREELLEARERALGLESQGDRAARRRELLARLTERGGLDRAEHDELIRLEVALDGAVSHPETPTCPACAGPLTDAAAPAARPDPTEDLPLPGAPGSVRCARSGSQGDLCRNVDARGLYACEVCGLVMRAWAGRKIRTDAHEPPVVRPGKSTCKLCAGRVADWSKHFLRCPRGRPADFPLCPLCDRRGFHARPLACPRCASEVAVVACVERAAGG